MRHAILLAACFISLPCWGSVDPAPADRERARVHALQTVGVKYRYGGRSPETGFDCSGLVAHVFKRAWGIALPASTDALKTIGRAVRHRDLQPGDLVFYNTRNRPFSHVGIYIGDGQFLHAPRTGAKVRVERVETAYWRARFNGARRLDPPTF